MRLHATAKEDAFRTELRAWLASTLPTLPDAPSAHDDWAARRVYDTAWQRRLYDAGYAGTSWPAELGGRGATPSEELIFLEETERAGAPYVGCNFVGTLHAGPTLIAEGTSEHRQGHRLVPVDQAPPGRRPHRRRAGAGGGPGGGRDGRRALPE